MVQTKEERNAYKRKWKKKNLEKVKETQKKYYEKNKEREKARSKEWAKKNREKLSERARERYHKDPEKARADSRKRYAKNVEQYRKRQNEYHAKDPEKWRKKAKEYRERNPEKVKAYRTNYQKEKAEFLKERRKTPEYRKTRTDYVKKVKTQVFLAYSKRLSKSDIPCCNCCGEKSHIEFLTIDHIEGRDDLPQEAKNLKGIKVYHYLRKNHYPKGYQVLCWNCNSAKGLFGKCPHKME